MLCLIFVGFSTAAEDALVDDLEVQAEQVNDTASESESEVEEIENLSQNMADLSSQENVEEPETSEKTFT